MCLSVGVVRSKAHHEVGDGVPRGGAARARWDAAILQTGLIGQT